MWNNSDQYKRQPQKSKQNRVRSRRRVKPPLRRAGHRKLTLRQLKNIIISERPLPVHIENLQKLPPAIRTPHKAPDKLLSLGLQKLVPERLQLQVDRHARSHLPHRHAWLQYRMPDISNCWSCRQVFGGTCGGVSALCGLYCGSWRQWMSQCWGCCGGDHGAGQNWLWISIGDYYQEMEGKTANIHGETTSLAIKTPHPKTEMPPSVLHKLVLQKFPRPPGSKIRTLSP